jgi:copper oxidase (laccase) domain-containing protein
VYAPEKHVTGVLHVGWRGIVAGAIAAFFERFEAEWNIEASQTLVAAGPSLCMRCAEFTDPRDELKADTLNIPSNFFDGRCADLQGIATAQFLSLGVLPDHIDRHPDCTRCRADFYWTYRGGDREAVQKGKTNVLACVLLYCPRSTFL